MQITKKRKRQDLLVSYQDLSQDEALASLTKIKEKLRSFFRNHVGNQQPATRMEIFTAVYGISPYALDIFRRNYWWSIIDKIMKELRRKDEVFIIRRGDKHYVMKTESDSNYYKGICDRDVTNLERAKDRADNWVAKKKWRNF